MPQILKQLAISIAGAIIVLLLIAIWDWASSGGVVAMLGEWVTVGFRKN